MHRFIFVLITEITCWCFNIFSVPGIYNFTMYSKRMGRTRARKANSVEL